MTQEAQRIAIAELMWMHVGCPHWVNANHEYSEDALRCMPNYLNDLNAMHEVEKVLTISQLPAYFYFLADKVNPRNDPIGFDWVKIHATAAQRAEAFLRTLNLWKE